MTYVETREHGTRGISRRAVPVLPPLTCSIPIFQLTDYHKFITMSAKVKETAKEEVQNVRKLANDGLKSGAYMYPIKVRTDTPPVYNLI